MGVLSAVDRAMRRAKPDERESLGLDETWIEGSAARRAVAATGQPVVVEVGHAHINPAPRAGQENGLR